LSFSSVTRSLESARRSVDHYTAKLAALQHAGGMTNETAGTTLRRHQTDICKRANPTWNAQRLAFKHCAGQGQQGPPRVPANAQA